MSATHPSATSTLQTRNELPYNVVAPLPDDHDVQLTRMFINLSNRARDAVRQNKLLGILCRYKILTHTQKLGEVPRNLSIGP